MAAVAVAIAVTVGHPRCRWRNWKSRQEAAYFNVMAIKSRLFKLDAVASHQPFIHTINLIFVGSQ
jgi:hypothetical protein